MSRFSSKHGLEGICLGGQHTTKMAAFYEDLVVSLHCCLLFAPHHSFLRSRKWCQILPYNYANTPSGNTKTFCIFMINSKCFYSSNRSAQSGCGVYTVPPVSRNNQGLFFGSTISEIAVNQPQKSYQWGINNEKSTIRKIKPRRIEWRCFLFHFTE